MIFKMTYIDVPETGDTRVVILNYFK